MISTSSCSSPPEPYHRRRHRGADHEPARRHGQNVQVRSVRQSRIHLTDSDDAIAQKIRKAKTDPEPLPDDPALLDSRPEAKNLVGIYGGDRPARRPQRCCSASPARASARSSRRWPMPPIALLAPLRERLIELRRDEAALDAILAAGRGEGRCARGADARRGLSGGRPQALKPLSRKPDSYASSPIQHVSCYIAAVPTEISDSGCDMMRINKLAAAVLLGVSALGLSACATGLQYPGFPLPGDAGAAGTKLRRRADRPQQRGRARILALCRAGCPADAGVGLCPGASLNQATMVVRVGYDVDDGHTEIVSDPFYGGYGGFGGWGYGGRGLRPRLFSGVGTTPSGMAPYGRRYRSAPTLIM